MKNRRIAVLPCLLFALACCTQAIAEENISPNAQEPQKTWLRMGGDWTVEKGRAFETRGFSISWDYHELMNYNGLVSQNIESDFTEIVYKFSIGPVKKLPVEAMLGFAINSPEQHYYYDFYAVKLTGDSVIMRTASLVQSKCKDKFVPVGVKGNYTVETLYTCDCPLLFNHDYELKVVRRNDTLYVYMENTLLFDYKLPPQTSLKGKFAFASRGACMSADSISVKNWYKTVLTDDFLESSIYVPTVQAVRVDKKKPNRPPDAELPVVKPIDK